MIDNGSDSALPYGDLHTDILIVGAGPVGMTLLHALSESGKRVLIVDRKPRGAWVSDPRTLALSHGSRQVLERLHAWDNSAATPIREIHVSQTGGFGRTHINASDYGLPALGYVMRYNDLAASLDVGIAQNTLINHCEVADLAIEGDEIHANIDRHGRRLRIVARLVVHAEGSGPQSPDVKVHDYGQRALIADVTTEPTHGHRAWERFTPDGPLALLPNGRNYAVVLTAPQAKAEELAMLNDEAFLDLLRERFGARMRFVSTGPRTSYPLALRVRTPLVRPRQVWIGNAAQTLHPVTGQGFNLGLRDAWELSEELHRCTDSGAPETLAAYAARRRVDRYGGAGFTDGIVRLFSNDISPLRYARGIGLLALDLAPPLRHFVARRMIWGARAWI